MRPSFARVAEALRARGVAAEPGGPGRGRAAGEEGARPAPFAGRRDRRGAGLALLRPRARRTRGSPRSAATDAALVELKAWHDRHNLWEDVPERRPVASLGGSGRLACGSRWCRTPTAPFARLLDRLGLAPAFDVGPGLGGRGGREAGSPALPPGPRAARSGGGDGPARGGHLPRGRGRGPGGRGPAGPGGRGGPLPGGRLPPGAVARRAGRPPRPAGAAGGRHFC